MVIDYIFFIFSKVSARQGKSASSDIISFKISVEFIIAIVLKADRPTGSTFHDEDVWRTLILFVLKVYDHNILLELMLVEHGREVFSN